ncbi:MAG: DUF3137 domain-containing protein [Aureispira sp.]
MLTQHQIEQQLLPALKPLEIERAAIAERLRIKTIQLVAFVVISSLVILIIFAVLPTGNSTLLTLPLVLGGILIPLMAIGINHYNKEQEHKWSKKFEAKVKQSVYQQIFKAWKSDCVYIPHEHITNEVFQKSDLYPNFTEYTGDDYCKGKLDDGRNFQFSELVVQQQYHSYEGQTEYKDIFKGLFFAIQGPHLLDGQFGDAQILPQSNQAYKKKKKKSRTQSRAKYKDNILDADFTASLAAKKKEEETPLFDQLYEINSQTEWTVRRRLTPEFYDQLNQIRSTLRQSISLSFKGDTVYMAVPHKFDFWIVNLKEPLNALQRVRYLAWNFKIAFELLERLEQATKAQ